MPLPTKVQLVGGAFQDSEGNVLANGYLEMTLSRDGVVTGVGNIASGITIKIQLDSNGNVKSSPAQSVWGNDQMLPVNSYYRVTGFTAVGQPAWGPNNQQVVGSGGTFDVGTWIPNQVISWTPPLQPLLLQVNEVDNVDQFKLDFKDSATVTWVDNGDGSVSATASSGAEIEVNSTPNASQAVLNFEDTPSVTWQNPSGGIVKATAAIPNLEVNSTPISSQSVLNFEDTASITWSNPSGGVIKATATSLPIFRAQVTLHAADLKALTTTPFQLVAAPSAGNAIVPIMMMLEYKFITPAFGATGTMTFFYGATNNANWAFQPRNAQNLLDQSTDQIVFTTPYQSSASLGAAKATADGSALFIGNDAAAITTGNGDLIVTIYYTIEPV